ncbi:murein hydrolase activator EnvC [Photobacterium kishitanii]|uniref:murein hydrolase activator EnvC n=1 Tax=Photobacterium kishitanii TaxID=318456 RepID=UPI00071AF0DA|nr:murein hydrolase activator EnvC [Photobacterium kishitanii]
MRDIINRHLNLKIRASALCTGAFLCVVFAAPCAASSQKQLDGVKQEISRQKNQLDSKQQTYAALQKQLKQHELDIAQTANKIHQTNDLLATITQSITQLEQQQLQLQQQQQQQLDVLKTLINAQYRQGNNSDIANLLSGENSAKLDRMTTYAEYVSKARASAIDALDATKTELQLKIHTLAEQKTEQQQALTELNQQKQQLDGQQQSRQLTLNKIKSQIQTSTEALADLRADEQNMLAAIAKAKAEAEARAKAEAAARARAEAEAQARIAAAKEAKAKAIAEAQARQLNARYAKMQVPMDGLASHKGKLIWPLRGPIIHNYGAPLQRELHWKGMVISQPIGSQVKAIYSGKVVFADWLRGYGLMIAIDHGKGDMSFYGYNQTLLKKIGDTVQAGEPIALVGDSGGQEQPGLYFQIRRKGTPVDPRPWLQR